MSAYAVTAQTLSEFRERDVLEEGLSYWEDLVDVVGGALPFLIRRESRGDIPYEELGLPRIDPAKLSPKTGEMWVLFCFLEDGRSRSSPIREDGFPLVLEWRKGVADSQLLSTAFHALAEEVRRQQGVSGWGLHPSYSRYGDQVAFTDPQLFANRQDPMFVASAYGALAAGLVCSVTGRHPHRWPFPTMQWDEKHHDLVGVMGLAQKFSVAVDFGARVVTVAKEQKEGAEKVLQTLRRREGGQRFAELKICSVSGSGDFVAMARRIAYVEADAIRRRCAAAVLMALTVLAVGGLIVGALWWRNKDRIQYFADYEGEFEIPVGIGEIPESELRYRDQYYEFVYSKPGGWLNCRDAHVLKSVICRDSWGDVKLPFFSEVTKRPAHREFSWFEGRLQTVKVYNEKDQLHYILRPRDERMIDVQVPPAPNFPADSKQKHLLPVRDITMSDVVQTNPAGSSFFAGMDRRGRSFTLCIQQRDGAGRPKRIAYRPYAGSEHYAFGRDGECGIRLQYDAGGRVESVRYLFASNSVACGENAVAGYDLRYGTTNAVVYVNHAERPVRGPDRYSCAWNVIDRRGTLTASGYWDERGNPDSGPERFAWRKYLRNRDQNLLRVESYDANGNRCVASDGAFARELRGKPSAGEIAFLGDDDRPVLNANGVAYMSVRKDGTCEEVRYFGVNHEPVFARDSWAHRVVIQERDRSGAYAKTFYGVDDAPALSKEGCARCKAEYVTEGLSSIEFYGVDLKTPCRSHGIMSGMSVRYVYDDEMGTLREIHYSLRSGKELAEDPRFGYDTECYVFDANGRTVEHYITRNGMPVANSITGVASVRYGYDESGECVRLESFAADRKTRVENRVLGASVVELQYGDGMLASWTFYSTNYCAETRVTPCICNEGYASAKILGVGLDGKASHFAFFDERRKPCMRRNFGAEMVTERTYTADGSLERTFCYDTEHRPVAQCGLAKVIERTFGFDGQLRSTAYFDEDGVSKVEEPVMGSHRSVTTYNYQGLPSRIERYDKNGGLVDNGLVENDYDSRGYLKRMRVYGRQRQLLLAQEFRPDGATLAPNGQWVYPYWNIGSTEDPELVVAVNGTCLIGRPELFGGGVKSMVNVSGNGNVSVIIASPALVGKDALIFEERQVNGVNFSRCLLEGRVVPLWGDLSDGLVRQFKAWLETTGRSVYWPEPNPDANGCASVSKSR